MKKVLSFGVAVVLSVSLYAVDLSLLKAGKASKETKAERAERLVKICREMRMPDEYYEAPDNYREMSTPWFIETISIHEALTGYEGAYVTTAELPLSSAQAEVPKEYEYNCEYGEYIWFRGSARFDNNYVKETWHALLPETVEKAVVKKERAYDFSMSTDDKFAVLICRPARYALFEGR